MSYSEYQRHVRQYKEMQQTVVELKAFINDLWLVAGVDDYGLTKLQAFVDTLFDKVICPVCGNLRYRLRTNKNDILWLDYCWLCNEDWGAYPEAHAAGLKKWNERRH